MQILTVSSMTDALKVPSRTIRAKAKHAKDHDLNHIQLKGYKFYFRNKKVGKGYEFCEVPFDELLGFSLPDSPSNDTFVSQIRVEHVKKDIDTASEVKISRLSVKKRRELDLKEKCVKAYLENRSDITQRLEMPIFIDRFCFENRELIDAVGLKINKTSIGRWAKKYLESGKAGLITQRGSKKGKNRTVPTWAVEFVEEMFFYKRGNITAKNLFSLVNAEAYKKGELSNEEFKKTDRELGGIISYNRVKVILRELKDTRKYKYLINPDAFKNSFLPAFGDMREKAQYANHYWEIDSTKLDAFGKDSNGDSTWNLISISDIKTGMKVLTIAKTSNSNAVAELIYKAINKLGLPENIVTDNGKDYLSNHIMGLLEKLGIQQVRTAPFAGEQKPFVERHFGTLQNSFTELLNGYKGHSVAQFKAIQSQISTADRISGNKPEKDTEFIHEISTMIDEWIDNVYSKQYNKGLQATPYEAYLRDEEFISRIDIQKLAFIFGKQKEVTIGKKGIRLNNKVYNFSDGLLAKYIGDRCILALDFIDISKGYLFDINGEFISMVTDEKISKEAALEAKAIYKHEVKALEKEHKKLAKKYKDENFVKTIIDTHKEVYANSRPIESIGGDAITQNSGNIKHLNNIADQIEEQLDRHQTINSKADLEVHERSLDLIIKEKEEQKAKKPVISYAELFEREAMA